MFRQVQVSQSASMSVKGNVILTSWFFIPLFSTACWARTSPVEDEQMRSIAVFTFTALNYSIIAMLSGHIMETNQHRRAQQPAGERSAWCDLIESTSTVSSLIRILSTLDFEG